MKKANICHAAKQIVDGELVIFPTETVYGIGADATNNEACLKIFAAKKRPSINPLIVHVSSLNEAQKIAIFGEDANILANLWPAPITLVLPLRKEHNIAKSVTSGLSTIAIRVPSNHVALELIKKAGCPIAAPSANLSGKLTSTTKAQAQEYFENQIRILGDDNSCEIGLESTILDLTSNDPVILRQGFFTKELLEKQLKKTIKIATKHSKIKAPGMMLKHYAPKTNIRLNVLDIKDNELALNFGSTELKSSFSLNLSSEGDLNEAARNLYKYLHTLDLHAQKNNYKAIAIAPIPNQGIGIAINDRIIKASHT